MARPSLTSQPAASSKSCPGVRMVTHARRALEPGRADPDLQRLLGDQPVLARQLGARGVLHDRVRTDGPGRRTRSLVTPPTLARGGLALVSEITPSWMGCGTFCGRRM